MEKISTHEINRETQESSAVRVKALLAVVLFSITVSTIVFLYAPDEFIGKTCQDCVTWYIPVAEQLLEGRGIVDPSDVNGGIGIKRPPGNSIIVAGMISVARLTGLPLEKVYWVGNSLMMAVSAVLLFYVSMKLWHSVGSSVIVAAVWTTCPFILWFLNQPYSEVPFILCLHVAGLIAVYRWPGGFTFWTALLIGVALGMAMLIRPIALGLPALVSVIIFAYGTRNQQSFRWLVKGIGVSLGAYCLVGIWSSYVWVASGEKIFISDGTLFATSVGDGFTFGVNQKGYREGVTMPEISEGVSEFMRDMNSRLSTAKPVISYTRDQRASNEYPDTGLKMYQLSYRLLKERPLVTVELASLKAVRAWFGTDSNKYEREVLALQFGYLGLVVSATYLGLRRRVITGWVTILGLAIVLYFWLMVVLVLPIVRYLIPVYGILFLALPGLWTTRRTMTQKRY